MLNIHARIHELKIKSGKGASSFRDDGSKPFDPIPPVAADITEESWLICFDEFQVHTRCVTMQIYPLSDIY